MNYTRSALLALLAVAVFDGVVTALLVSPEWEGAKLLLPVLPLYAVVFWWLHQDSAAHAYQPSGLLKVGIVLMIMVFMPVYLFKSRPAGGRLRPIAAFFGVLLAYVLVSSVVQAVLG